MPVWVIDTLKPKNGLDFPVVEAVDVAVEGYSSLADAVAHFATDTAIATIAANLQAQIDQIEISASAESVVAPEVAAARVGVDGASYQTLKARLDAEINAANNDIENIESGFLDGQYYVGLKFTAVTTAVSRANSQHISAKSNPLIVMCADTNLSFYVTYYDITDTVISNTNWAKTEQTYSTFPANTATLVVTIKNDNGTALTPADYLKIKAYTVPAVNGAVEVLSEQVETISEGYSKLIDLYGGYVDANGVIIAYTPGGRHYTNLIPVVPETVITYRAETNHQNISALTVYNGNGEIIDKEINVGSLDTDHTYTVPNGAYFVRFSLAQGQEGKFLFSKSPVPESICQIANITADNTEKIDAISVTETNLNASFTSGKYIEAVGLNVGDNWTTKLTDNTNSKYLAAAIDVSDYRGLKIEIVVSSHSSSSTRALGFCDGNNIVSIKYSEGSIPYKTVDGRQVAILDIVDDYFFFSFSFVNIYGIYVYDDKFENRVTEIAFSKAQTIELIHGAVYVDSVNGNDNNDGSSVHPLKTIQAAVDKKIQNIIVVPGIYEESVEISGIKGLNIMPKQYGTYSTSTPDTPKIKLVGDGTLRNGLRINNSYEINITGVWCDNYAQYGCYINECPSITMTDCVASNCESGGIVMYNASGTFKDCLAYNIGGGGAHTDGFNIHGYGDTQFINCVAHDCGDDGISHHDGCTGLIIGGEYYNNGKGGVASPTHGACIDVQGVYSHNNAYGLYASNDSNRTVKGRITNCVFKNNNNKDIYINDGNIVGWNNIYDTKSVASGSSFLEF